MLKYGTIPRNEIRNESKKNGVKVFSKKKKIKVLMTKNHSLQQSMSFIGK